MNCPIDILRKRNEFDDSTLKQIEERRYTFVEMPRPQDHCDCLKKGGDNSY
jgi:hypothetical protein